MILGVKSIQDPVQYLNVHQQSPTFMQPPHLQLVPHAVSLIGHMPLQAICWPLYPYLTLPSEEWDTSERRVPVNQSVTTLLSNGKIMAMDLCDLISMLQAVWYSLMTNQCAITCSRLSNQLTEIAYHMHLSEI